ncbi:MAG TPA: alpha/beta hydrolase [Chitinophagaceae bacterium]|nr:alpha/beta hydrolase [Chitinophagaceae bacterium]
MRITIATLVLAIWIAACQDQSKKTDGSFAKNGTDTAVNEKSFIELGGEKQYVEITGASSRNPVLLFIHGGPGWPQTPHLRYFNADLTKDVILVAWEQSGSGKSFMQNPEPKNLSLEQIVSDAHELTQILKKKFNQDKVYVAGFSWGSTVGLKLIDKYPDDYIAYFGISQVLSARESIRQSRKWITEQARSRGDKPALAALERIEKGDTGICKKELECFYKQYEFLTKYGGAIYKKESEAEIEKAVTKYEDYKDYDWMKAFNYSIGRLENDLFNTDLRTITETKIPVYFLVGRHDWNIPAHVTETYVSKLKAPKKEVIWFDNSGHEPLEEEAAKFNQVIIEKIRSTNAQ